jgi:hypothetical protein
MPAVPTAPDFVDGLSSSSQLNQLRDAIRFMQQRPRAKLSQRTLQTLTNATFAAVSFDNEIVDTDVDNVGGHDNSTNPTRWTARYRGLYSIHGTVTFDANATGVRYAMLRINGVDQEATNGSLPGQAASAISVHTHPGKLFLADGDYVELVAYQNSGGNLNTYVGSDYARSALDILWESI